MVAITVKAYENAGVHIITVENKKLFCVTMIDVQNGLGIKNISDLLRQETCGWFETKNPTEKQKQKYVRTRKEIIKTIKNDPYGCK